MHLKNVESLVRAPAVTLITDWPIIAHPPIAPRKPVTKLATPWPTHSLFLLLPVSVMSSTIEAVRRLSSNPTAAIVSE
jgi:hypothetical protein